jgi:hydroxylamine reductase
MFCYQCEQTSKGEGCQTLGVCGKDETTAALQDLLLQAVKGISIYAHRARQLGAADAQIDAFTIQAIFTTLTNVNFDPERLVELIRQAITTRDAARNLYESASVAAGVVPAELGGVAAWKPAASATTRTPRCRSRWPSHEHLTAASTIFRFRWFSPGMSRRPSRCC